MSLRVSRVQTETSQRLWRDMKYRTNVHGHQRMNPVGSVDAQTRCWTETRCGSDVHVPLRMNCGDLTDHHQVHATRQDSFQLSKTNMILS